ncbi:MAG: HNH endonuclease domain-containing protein [Succinatimonas sp.]|nr:HNH endonuclease domain-containing protein [Succinatimonas sp.]
MFEASPFRERLFTPWSFCKEDKLWNFVLSCSSCNISKSNLIVESKYLEKLVQRNQGLVKVIVKDFLENYQEDALRRKYDRASKNMPHYNQK